MASGGMDWWYLDSTGQEYGPFPEETMREWFQQGFFPIGENLLVRLTAWKEHVPLHMVYPKLSDAFLGPPRIPAGEQRPRPQQHGFPRQQYQHDSSGDYPANGQGPYTVDGHQGLQGRRLPDAAGMPMGAGPPMQQPLGAYWAMPPAGQSYEVANMGYGAYHPQASQSQGQGGYSMGGHWMPDTDFYRAPSGGGRNNGMSMQNRGGQGASGGRYSGCIKSFNLKQGFGFIECAEAHQVYGRDVFLHKAQIGDFQVGTELTFAVEMNKQGMPQARDLMSLDGMRPGPTPTEKGGGGAGGGKGGRKGGKEDGTGKRKGQNSRKASAPKPGQGAEMEAGP